MINKLDWDSDFFGKRIGEWQTDTPPDAKEGFEVVYAKSSKPILKPLEGFEKSHDETRVVFTKKLQNARKVRNTILAFAGSGFNKEDLYPVAFESGKYSRFKLDVKFGEESFKKLYTVWVDNSVTGKFADNILIDTEGRELRGMVTYKVQEHKAVIGLIGILPGYQGKGIGRGLLESVEKELIETNINELTIPTQLANNGACEFYKKNGYVITETTYISHFWKDDTI